MDHKGTLATILGTGALIAFGAACVYLAQQIGNAQQEWDRLVFIFGGVEAIAFAAAGYFFGKEINRTRAENAEGQAKEAQAMVASREGAKSTAETKLADLKTYIATHGPSRNSAYAEYLPQLDRLAIIHGLASAPGYANVIEEITSAQAISAADPHWERLQKFADNL